MDTTAATTSRSRKLDSLGFDNSVLRCLPVDKEERNFVRAKVSNACFSKVPPTPVENPRVIAVSTNALALLDLDPTEVENPEFAQYFGGCKVLPGSEPSAHCYCGHQFGNFAGQLGDGRAIYLGELVNSKGERWELQLKGAGRTPYSRDGDGRAVLRSSVREFLCSEAMYYLGIPTTRAGSIVTSDTYVIRDIKYDGHPIRERVTVCSRIAPTFIRFGSLQICNGTEETGRSGPSAGKYNLLYKILDYIIEYHYPLINKQENERESKYREFFKEIVDRTARLAAEWQAVGFCHGVLNTDNMSITGLTLDYGPFGFMEFFNQDYICNSSDDGGRYSYGNQPAVCEWNLERLADAIEPALEKTVTEPILETYDTAFKKCYVDKMRKKLGLKKEMPGDEELIEHLKRSMQHTGADYTNVLRCLSKVPMDHSVDIDPNDTLVKHILAQCCSVGRFRNQWAPRIPAEQLQYMVGMIKQNPQFLEMVGISAEFIESELARIEKYEEVKKMTPELKSLSDQKIWCQWLQEYKTRLAVEIEGIQNDTELQQIQQERVSMMNSNNPKFILRNYIAQKAIEKAENGDYSEVNRLLELLKDPFGEAEKFAEFKYDTVPPDWSATLCVSCSS